MKSHLFGTKVLNDEPVLILQEPLYGHQEDFLALKKYSKLALIELRDIYPNITLAFSGGMDACFALLCFVECIEEGTLTKDAFNIAMADYYYTEDISFLPDSIYQRMYQFLRECDLKVDFQKVILDSSYLKQIIKQKIFTNRYDDFDHMLYEYWRLSQDSMVVIYDNFPAGGKQLVYDEYIKYQLKNNGIKFFQDGASSYILNRYIHFLCIDETYNNNTINLYSFNAPIYDTFLYWYKYFDNYPGINRWNSSRLTIRMDLINCFPQLINFYPGFSHPALRYVAPTSPDLLKDFIAQNRFGYNFLSTQVELFNAKVQGVETVLPDDSYFTSLEQSQKYFKC